MHAGGITHLRRIAALADLYNVRTGCHGATDLSPVCMSAALHFDISIPNFGIQEWMHHTKETDEVFQRTYTFSDGMLHPGEVPGLGVEIDEKLAAKYPLQTRLPAGEPAGGRQHVQLVGAHERARTDYRPAPAMCAGSSARFSSPSSP